MVPNEENMDMKFQHSIFNSSLENHGSDGNYFFYNHICNTHYTKHHKYKNLTLVAFIPTNFCERQEINQPKAKLSLPQN